MAIANIFHMAIIHITVITECLCSNDMLRMCYFNASARHRVHEARFDSFNIDFSLCTHYIYGYAEIDYSNYVLSPMDPSQELGNTGAYRDFTTRDVNTADNPKRLLSIGGPNITAQNTFHAMSVSYADNQYQAFSVNSTVFLRKHNFGGLDIDWQYPFAPGMLQVLMKLLRYLRAAFDLDTAGEKLLLTVKCPAEDGGYNYDVHNLSRFADYVILAAYNITPPNASLASFGSPLYGQRITVNSTVRAWLERGLPANKTVVGISAVGRFAMLINESQYSPNSPIEDRILPGFFYSIPGGLAYPEVCEIRTIGNDFFDGITRMNYVANKTLWVGYEGKDSIADKIAWMKSLNIRGLLFAGLDEDDFNGTHCKEGKYPLLNYIKSLTTSPKQTLPIQTTTRKPDVVEQTTASPLPTIPGAGPSVPQRTLLSTVSTTVSGLTTRVFVYKNRFYNFYRIILLIFLFGLAVLLIACMYVLRGSRDNHGPQNNK